MSEPKHEFTFEKFDESNCKSYDGQCHCGKVQFTVSISPPIEGREVTSCNCSICSINGYLNVYAPDRKMVFLPDKETAMKDLTEYGFGKGRVVHFFCKTCGSSICGRPTEYGKTLIGDIWTINSRALKGLEIEKLKLKMEDGKNLL